MYIYMYQQHAIVKTFYGSHCNTHHDPVTAHLIHSDYTRKLCTYLLTRRSSTCAAIPHDLVDPLKQSIYSYRSCSISEKTLRKPTLSNRSLDVYVLTSLTRTHCAYVQKFKHVHMRTGYVTADSPPSTHARNRMRVCPALFFEAVYFPSRAERKVPRYSVLKREIEGF